MFFDELSNDEWAQLSALVSDEPAVRLNRRGRPRAEPRIVTNAVLWILTTGEPWSKLPGRYPSGPTCRRRFEEWQLNGTLAEMVRLLSQTGRRFAYIPEPSVPVAQPAPVVVAPAPRDDVRGVFWKSPESWQAPQGVANEWRPVDPFAEITRQLSGLPEDAPVHVDRRAATAASDANHAIAEAGEEQGRRQDGRNDEQQGEGARSPLWKSLSTARGTEFVDRRGYVVYVMAQPVPNEMYRAWAEIMQDGKRVERSGLVGPRFEHPEAAKQYALDWARQWIDRHSLTLAAQAEAEAMRNESSRPVSRPMPAPRPVQAASATPAAAPSASASVDPVKPPNAPLAAPVSVNARRVPLRHYPGDSAADAADRFPTVPELISYLG